MTDSFTLPANGSFSFKGRTALVTGGGRGVGEAVARELHAGGAQVAISDVDLEAAQAVADSLDPSATTAIAIPLNVRCKEDFLAARDRIAAAWGRIDIVVNNAGYAKRTPTQDISPEEFDEIVQINMRSVFLSCQIFSEHMREHGYGRIVNITSLAGQNGGTVASPLRSVQGWCDHAHQIFRPLSGGLGCDGQCDRPRPDRHCENALKRRADRPCRS
jgi:3-oxoacyl-[acyl-carrier protein] reductase